MFSKEVLVPSSVNVEISESGVRVKGSKGELKRAFKIVEGMRIETKENKVIVSSDDERRKVRALVGTTASHIKNMIEGVEKGFTYKLRVVYSHFPITVKIEKDKVLINNFLGEKTPRRH